MEQTAKSLYSRLENARSPFLNRAYDCAELTIPHLLPRAGHSSASKLPTPFQGLGARGVNNLSSKLLLALLPPNAPFFRLHMDESVVEELEGEAQQALKTAILEALANIERRVMDEVETEGVRTAAAPALRQLIVTGNVLVYLPPEGGMRVYKLNQYVVRRDPSGNVLDILVREQVSPATLSDDVLAALSSESPDVDLEKSLDLFTHVARDGRKWKVRQEINHITVPGSEGSYPLEKSPWIAMRWAKIDGEDYGRGYVEEYLGDLQSLEGLTQAIVEGSAGAARTVFLVRPNGVTDIRDFQQAENLDVIAGNEDDISTAKVDKGSDFRVTLEASQRIEERLAYAFMLNSSVQRTGERVTAEEIRYMAGELEDGLGGIYSLLSQEFQLPLVRRLMHQMEKQGRLPKMPDGSVRPMIVTGVEALGRGHDLDRLMGMIQALSQPIPEPIAQYLNIGEFIARVCVARGVDPKGLIKSEEQIAEEQQQAQMMQMMQQGLGPGIQAGGRLLEKGMEDGAGAEAQGTPEA
jgi:hypothetical protein